MEIKEEEITKIIEFLYKYNYSEYERFGVLLNIFDYTANESDICSQIRAYLGLDKGCKDAYMGYLQILKKYFTLDRDIVEVGAGHFPIMSHYIDNEQIKIKKGTITAYDPKLVVSSLGNISLQKKEFTLNTPIKNSSLLFGISPCQATDIIVKKSCMEETEFFISMCFCPPYNGDYRPLYQFAKRISEPRSEIIVENLPKEYGELGSVIIKKKY